MRLRDGQCIEELREIVGMTRERQVGHVPAGAAEARQVGHEDARIRCERVCERCQIERAHRTAVDQEDRRRRTGVEVVIGDLDTAVTALPLLHRPHDGDALVRAGIGAAVAGEHHGMGRDKQADIDP